MPNITSLLKYSLKTNIVKSILFEIISNTSRYFYTFGQSREWPTVVGPRSANIFTVERTNNIVRITTRTPHGLIEGDNIIVSANTITQVNNPPTVGAKNISTIERSADYVTIITDNAHGFLSGSTVEISSNVDAIDGIFTVIIDQEFDEFTFKYYHPGNNIASTTTTEGGVPIDGTASQYTAFVVLDVVNDLTFTYEKIGVNISTTQEIGQVYSVERQVISSETDPPSVSDNYPYELEIRNNMLLMKLIDSNDASIVIPRINWRPGITYDMFDEYSGDRLSYSGASSLATAEFYVLTDEFNVYKCIFNNNDQPSSIKPTSTSPTSEELTLADGYIWKFMYTIPISLRNKFLTSQYMPVLSALSNQFYSSGSITNYSIVSSGYAYISNTYSVKSLDIVDNGSGYTTLSNQAANTFNIVSIQRTNNEMTITVDENHGVESYERGVISISCDITSVDVAGNAVPLDLISNNGLRIIKSIPSINSFTIENSGADIPLTNTTGSIQTTGAVIIFPIPETGVQAKAYVSEYGSGGTIDKVVISETGSGYLTPPIPEIYMLNGLNPSKAFEYNISYSTDTSNGYTEVTVEGDGFNANNPYSLKRVIINDGERGVYPTQITGEIFIFPEPDLPQGRKPQVQVVFSPLIKQYQVVESGRLALNGGTVVLTLDLGTDTSVGYTIGDSITVSLAVNPQYNGTYTITNVVDNFVFYELAGAEEQGVAESGAVVNVSGEIGYEVSDVIVIDEGYGYSKPLKFGDDATGNYFSVFANDLTINGFNCSLDENNQKNAAVLLPLINANGEIESIQIIEPGVGYTYAFVSVKGYKKVGSDLVLMNSTNTPSFIEANIQLRFSVGDIESKQSTVELLAKDGAISCIKVDNGGQGYAVGTRIVVLGDGSGCEAVPEIVGGKIEKVTIIDPGTGYTNAIAYVSGPAINNDPLNITPVTSGSNADIRVILSPKGGHGKDAISELYGRSIYFTSRLSNEKNKGIVTKGGTGGITLEPNDYRQITILKNPFSYGKNEYYRNNLGSACFLAGCDVTTNNTAAFNALSQDDVIEYNSVTGVKEYVIVEKEEIGDKYYLVLHPLNNYIPEINSIFTKVIGTNTYSIVMTSLELPDFNKFSGEMLYVNNRSGFTPSEEQSVVISTLINF